MWTGLFYLTEKALLLQVQQSGLGRVLCLNIYGKIRKRGIMVLWLEWLDYGAESRRKVEFKAGLRHATTGNLSVNPMLVNGYHFQIREG